ncbi:MAG: hypothetical protein ACR2OG_09580 [Gemmatimonadaceae bacterium]
MPVRERYRASGLNWRWSAIAATILLAIAQADAQSRPYSLGEITSLLQAHVSPVRVLALARSKCIGFRMDEQASRRLKAAGMSRNQTLAMARVCSGVRPARPEPVAVLDSAPSPKTLVHVQLALAAGQQGSLPRMELLLIADEGDTARVRTGATGSAELLLTPGHYILRSARAAELEGWLYRWQIPVIVLVGMPTVVLDGTNAIVDAVPR